MNYNRITSKTKRYNGKKVRKRFFSFPSQKKRGIIIRRILVQVRRGKVLSIFPYFLSKYPYPIIFRWFATKCKTKKKSGVFMAQERNGITNNQGGSSSCPLGNLQKDFVVALQTAVLCIGFLTVFVAPRVNFHSKNSSGTLQLFSSACQSRKWLISQKPFTSKLCRRKLCVNTVLY